MSDTREIAVSVAVITYNLEKYLPTLLDSILEQETNFRYEIVVDDDHSPDHSREILKPLSNSRKLRLSSSRRMK